MSIRGPSPSLPGGSGGKPGISGLEVLLPGEVDGYNDDGVGDELDQSDGV
jgi:hypothetical protein